jgi:hypothetical protein
MTLRGIIPQTHVDGFIAELIKHHEQAVALDTVSLIDYCYEICITCDGTNPYYERKSRAVFLVTQCAHTEASTGFVTGNDHLPIIVLGSNEELGSAVVVESKQHGIKCTILIFTITNRKTDARRTLSWIVRKSEVQTMH